MHIENRAYWINALHAGFWIAFVAVRLFARTRSGNEQPEAAAAPATAADSSSKSSRLILIPQLVALGILYPGIDTPAPPHRFPS